MVKAISWGVDKKAPVAASGGIGFVLGPESLFPPNRERVGRKRDAPSGFLFGTWFENTCSTMWAARGAML